MTRKSLTKAALKAASGIASVRDFLRDRSGSISAEFALVLPMTAMLVGGLVDFGLAVNNRTSLENGARAGVQFALDQGLNMTGIRATVVAASNLAVANEDVTAAEWYECSDSWGTEVEADADCGDDVPLAKFIQVSVTQTYTPFFPFLDLVVPSQMLGTATVRVP